MYFYEVIEKCDTELLIKNFLTFCVDAPDIEATEQAIRNTITILSGIEAITSDTGMLFIEKIETEDESYDAAHLFDTKQNQVYGIEANPWAKTLGYIADEKSLSFHGYERFAALVLWEMTWFGYTEESVQEKVKSWSEMKRCAEDI